MCEHEFEKRGPCLQHSSFVWPKHQHHARRKNAKIVPPAATGAMTAKEKMLHRLIINLTETQRSCLNFAAYSCSSSSNSSSNSRNRSGNSSRSNSSNRNSTSSMVIRHAHGVATVHCSIAQCHTSSQHRVSLLYKKQKSYIQ